MARLPRLSVGGLPHLVSLYAAAGNPAFVDAQDRQAFLAAWREAAAAHPVALHAYMLADDHVHLLATPADAAALGLAVQALGRRYVAAYNRRHGRQGALWAGRFRATVVQPGEPVLEAMVFIDGHGARQGQPEEGAHALASSAAVHLGQRRDGLLQPAPAWWQLGNTPFEREAAYRQRLDEGLAEARIRQIADAARKGWPLGDSGFLAQLGQATARPLAPRPRGRPARNLQSPGDAR